MKEGMGQISGNDNEGLMANINYKREKKD